MEFKMHLRESPFYKIKSGKKDIELRLYDEKRRKIKPGDTIEFSNLETGQIINATVVDLHIFNNFEELYNSIDKSRIGYDEDEQVDPAHMYQYYSKEEIEKNGVVGIEIKLD